MVKIILESEDDVETLWAEQLPSGYFRLDNAPFFFYGVSADDILEASPEPNTENLYRFVRVVERSGNYTIRILSEEPSIISPEFKPIADRLQEMKCDYEGFPPTLLSVTIPVEADRDAVLDFLNQKDLTWEYANPTYAELFGEDE